MAPNGKPLVVGLGDPVMDILASVSHEYLATVTSEPGGCFAIAPEEMEKLLTSAAEQSALKRIPGGSAANVMKGMANLGQGTLEAKFVGMIGKDATGEDYRHGLQAQGVRPLLLETDSGAPSACAVCLVTPDGQRTMRTCLGASLELQSSSQLPADWCSGLQLLHCEGYCLYRPKLTQEMTSAAKKAGAIVSIDLASFELVRNCKDSFLSLLQSGCLDLLFANEVEAATLAVEFHLVPATATHEEKVEAAQNFLLQHIQVSVVSLGPKGCVVRNAAGDRASAPAAKVKVIDTIGAGDFFTSGFLYAFTHGATLQQCAEVGCAAGAEAVQSVGAELSEEAWPGLRQQVEGILAPGGGKAAAASSGAVLVTAAAGPCGTKVH
mmetsp:Transcript_21380/g.46797  ORF Transcript_21380/g.46797 Transcript_21380/m.46797 type:complete len:380 (+) Transcript_21380:82-1221(+)|eukprot:CAMPEP_0202899544 /NCGR_PEP_ID=MMETSP1392-20130828/7739_1 /ASSEMBLY_ACC=CAM_ASM_000868 /TAXON_ID=225041 /ORGANISM="Chlamydomonas chlamydogama, Strain SAG 11-48b" /LENGTH=379 /DNA_ID=CAMNT_0049585745 /DNA_START=69 /DNA_END=1208 /DNA_ORIENTATION=-